MQCDAARMLLDNASGSTQRLFSLKQGNYLCMLSPESKTQLALDSAFDSLQGLKFEEVGKPHTHWSRHILSLFRSS